MPLPEQELIAAVEAVVFVSSEPVTLARLQEVFADETAELACKVPELSRTQKERWLTVNHLTRAGDEIRTRDVQLGKLSLYH